MFLKMVMMNYDVDVDDDEDNPVYEKRSKLLKFLLRYILLPVSTISLKLAKILQSLPITLTPPQLLNISKPTITFNKTRHHHSE